MDPARIWISKAEVHSGDEGEEIPGINPAYLQLWSVPLSFGLLNVERLVLAV
jgi:hypothetical protein